MSADWIEVIGLAAAASTVVAFSRRRVMSLRVAAILANVFFIIQASELHLRPVLSRHCLLLPMNIMRLAQCLRSQQPLLSRKQRS